MMCALIVEQKGCARGALARALTLRAASSGVGVCAVDAKTVLPIETALQANPAAGNAPVARPRRCRRGQRGLGVWRRR